MHALVQYDGSSDDEDSEMDTEVESTSASSSYPVVPGSSAGIRSTLDPDEIQDSEDEDNSILETNQSSISSTLHLEKLLPQPKERGSVDANELAPIPPKKVYGDEEKLQPRPSTSTFADILVTKKKSGTGIVQISIPSQKDYDDDDDIGPQKRKIFQGSQKTSGLFDILPPPKNDFTLRTGSGDKGKDFGKSVTFADKLQAKSTSTTSTHFVPHAVKQAAAGKRPAPVDDKLEKIKAKFLKQEFNVKVVSKTSVPDKPKNTEAESDDEDGESNDFFSLESKPDEKLDYVAVDLPPELQPKAVQIYSGIEEEMDVNGIDTEAPLPTPFDQRIQAEREDLLKYIQPSRKGRGKAEEINVIEVNADDLRPQTSDWLKTITDTSIIPPRKAVLPGGMTKRKHQITYLAAEAKAREQELQNEWAANRHAKRQTQNKYGF